MNSNNVDGLPSEREEIPISNSNILGFKGKGQQEIPDLQGKQLAEYFQKEMADQRVQMRKVEEKCHAILVKIPLMEHRTEDVAAIRRELELEKEQRKAMEKHFMECIDLLKKEILQANLKVSNLEKRIEDMDKQNMLSTSSTSHEECISEVVGRLINDLSDDINARFEVLEENQEKLQVQIQTTRKDQNMSYFLNSTGEAVVEGTSPSIIPDSNSDTQAPRVNNFGIEACGMSGVSPMDMEEPGRNTTVMPHSTIDQTVNLGTGDDSESSDDVGVIHGQAQVPGRHLPMLCLCGLEFASTGSLVKHLLNEIPKYVSTTLSPLASTSTSQSQPQLATTSTLAPPLNIDNNSVAHGLERRPVDAVGNPTFYCKCGRCFCSRNSLKYHIRVASGVLFQCPVCFSRFTTVKSLRIHMKHKHQVEYMKGKKACARCGQMFNNMMDLLTHKFTSHAKT